MTYDEIAVAMGISVMTVRRRWQFARAWLARELGEAKE
jgi:DNA-directed RNA polymerase specialized sigma24 family protein